MKTRVLAVLFLMAMMVIPAFAGYEMYLTIDGIAGAPLDTKHTDWITVLEMKDSTLKTAGTVGLVISKATDSNSGALYKDCLTGRARPNAMLDVLKDGVLVCKMTMRNSSISQIKPQLTKADPVLQEEMTLSFSEITWDFYSTGADGKTVTSRTGWNNETKKAM
jgi:type VI protein secretion system component Hcp